MMFNILQKYNNQHFYLGAMADKKDLLSKSYALESDISRLKRELCALTSKKRSLYGQLDVLRVVFRPVINKIKELKSKRDEHTASVKELKTKRQAASSVAKTAISDLKQLRTEKDKKSQKLGVRRPAAAIISEIKKLDFKIETEVIPFEKEQRLTKIIKEKKVELEKAKQLIGVMSKLKSSSHKLESSKSRSDEAHQELQLHASVSQKLHEDMLSHAKTADHIKAKMKPLFREKSEITQKYSALKTELDKKLAELDSVSEALGKIKADEDRQKQLVEEKRIQATEKELTDKMKSGKKLTMDDLIKLKKVDK